MSKLQSEKEMVSTYSEFLKSTKELNDTIRDILDNGTLEQKVKLLVNDYRERMINDEFEKEQKLQSSLLSYRLENMCSAHLPILPKF